MFIITLPYEDVIKQELLNDMQHVVRGVLEEEPTICVMIIMHLGMNTDRHIYIYIYTYIHIYVYIYICICICMPADMILYFMV